jgi:rSAM/selenodomain-associated transferase 1
MQRYAAQHTSGNSSCGIAVMAKASAAGRTKTRLVPPLTFDEAADFNTAFLKDVAHNIASAAESQSIAGYMAFGPPGSNAFFEAILSPSIGLLDCWYPDFGECLFNAVTQLLDRGHDSAVVLNADSPTLPTSLLVETAQVLARPGDRAVLGPSTDGGYYLLGLKAPHRRLFEDVTWSSEHVARQTLERAAEIGLDVHVLPAWYDVDDAEALRMLRAELYDGWSFAPRLEAHRALQTERLMHTLLSGGDLARRLDGVLPSPLVNAAE